MNLAMTLLAFLIGAAVVDVGAETVTDLSIESTYDSNIFGTSSQSQDYLTQAATTLAHRETTDASDFRLYYAGTAYLFTESTDRSFSVHGLGVTYSRKLGKGRNKIYAGSTFRARLDRDVFTVYDYAGFRAFANVKFYANPKTMFRIGYALETRNYWNLDVSGYSDQYLFLQTTRFLPSRTTIRGDLSYSQKDHGGSEGQIVLGAQVAQSVRAGTGLSLRYQRRANIEPGSANGPLSEDQDILFDRYDYSGDAVTLRLTQQLPFAARLVLSAGYESQRFDGQLALDGDLIPVPTLEERRDRIAGAGASFELPITSRIDLGLNYGFEQSRSNDATYQYDGRHTASVGFDLDF